MNDRLNNAAQVIQHRLDEKGYQAGHYQAVWRGYGMMPNGQLGWGGKALETFNGNDATLAILDALIHQGGYSIYDGDGVGCVQQMIEIAYMDRDFWRDQTRRAQQRIQDLEQQVAEFERLKRIGNL